MQEEDYRLFMQNIKGVLALALDEELIPIFIEGAIEEITDTIREIFFPEA